MRKARSRLLADTPPLTRTYLHHWPTAVLSLIGCLLLAFILLKIQPAQIRHLILPNTYLPFLICVWGTFFFASSFILLNSRRGFLLSTAITAVLFLQLQQVVLTWPVLLILAIIFTCLWCVTELLLLYSRRK